MGGAAKEFGLNTDPETYTLSPLSQIPSRELYWQRQVTHDETRTLGLLAQERQEEGWWCVLLCPPALAKPFALADLFAPLLPCPLQLINEVRPREYTFQR